MEVMWLRWAQTHAFAYSLSIPVKNRLLSSGVVACRMAGCPPKGAQHLVKNTPFQYEKSLTLRSQVGARESDEDQCLIPIFSWHGGH